MQQIKAAPPAAPARPQVDPNKTYTIPLSNAPDARAATASEGDRRRVRDYQCPFCGQAEGLMKQVLEAYPNDVRVVYKQFPLTTIHPQAMLAAKAALAAGRQGKYWEMHDLAVREPARSWAPTSTRSLRRAALDVIQFQKDMDSPEVLAQIKHDMQDGKAADVTGTPTMFVNGKRLMNRSFDGFSR